MTVSARDSLFSGEFTTRLGSMSNSHVNWKQNIPSQDGGSIEHPIDNIFDLEEVPEIQHEKTSIDKHWALLHECFGTLHHWARQEKSLNHLYLQLTAKEDIDFDKQIPVHYHFNFSWIVDK